MVAWTYLPASAQLVPGRGEAGPGQRRVALCGTVWPGTHRARDVGLGQGRRAPERSSHLIPRVVGPLGEQVGRVPQGRHGRPCRWGTRLGLGEDRGPLGPGPVAPSVGSAVWRHFELQTRCPFAVTA